MHLILKANFTEGKFKDIVVKRGQTVTSSQHLADETGLSRQQIRTAIDKLLSTNEITYTSTNRYIVITLCNYEAYNPKGKISTSTATSTATNNQPSNNHQVTTIEEGEEGEEGKEVKDMCDFEEVWKALPERNGKRLERKATFTRYKQESLKDRPAILIAAKNYANSDLVKRGIGIKDPKRFLLNWQDWKEAETGKHTTTNLTEDEIDKALGL
jgi:hypothetical protein